MENKQLPIYHSLRLALYWIQLNIGKSVDLIKIRILNYHAQEFTKFHSARA